MAILREILGKAEAVKACAVARAKEVVIPAAMIAKSKCKTRFLVARDNFRLWLRERAQERAFMTEMRHFNKEMYRMECKLKKVEWFVSMREYKQWRKDQSEIVIRDIWERVNKLDLKGIKIDLPPPVRPGQYIKRPSPLPPKKPLVQSYKEYLETTNQYVSLFDKTVHVVLIRPAHSIVLALVIGLALTEALEELKSPGTVKEHLEKLSHIAVPEGKVDKNQ